MKDKLLEILKQAEENINSIKTIHDLHNTKSHFIGKKSIIKDLMKHLTSLPPEERPAFGKQVNDVMRSIEKFIEEAETRINENEYQDAVNTNQFDPSMPGRPLQKGSKHPLTLVQEKLEDVMISMGFQVVEGFDVEDDYHNFDALNHPLNHPARNLADTFYVNMPNETKWNSILLRTHTSPDQIRVMEKYKPPFKIISIGRAYRNDRFDPTHSPVFSQCEGLVVGEDISFKDLKNTIEIFIKNMFGSDCESRFRPHFFPFTEPSAEVDISCFICKGQGCAVCKNSGWIEIMGAGMVHPNVFDILKIDNEKYTGYAFGCGIERIAMLTYHIPDIRLLYENDLRFLKQFG